MPRAATMPDPDGEVRELVAECLGEELAAVAVDRPGRELDDARDRPAAARSGRGLWRWPWRRVLHGTKL